MVGVAVGVRGPPWLRPGQRHVRLVSAVESHQEVGPIGIINRIDSRPEHGFGFQLIH